MGEIKSAAEIAREKLEKIGEPTPEERLKWKYAPEGEKLAARYLKDGGDLASEVGKYDTEGKQTVMAIPSTLERFLSGQLADFEVIVHPPTETPEQAAAITKGPWTA